MRIAHLPISVMMERRTVTHLWSEDAWSAVAVMPDRGNLPRLQPLGRSETREHYLVSGLELELYSDENEGYFEN